MSTVSCCDVDKLSYSGTSDQVSIQEPTELDRILVRVTEAVLDAAVNTSDMNANNEEHDCPDLHAPLPMKLTKSKTIGRRFRSLFRFGRKTSKASVLEQKPLPKLIEEAHGQRQNQGAQTDPYEQPYMFQELTEDSHLQYTGSEKNCLRDDPNMNNNQGRTCGGGCRSGAAAVSPIVQDQTSPGTQLIDLSNTADTTTSGLNSPSATPDSQNNRPQSKWPQPLLAAAHNTQLASNAPTSTRVYRGGASTRGHQQKQDVIFRECRVLPIDTLYKKVSIVPGQERLFLSAPTNVRSLNNPMVYDIAFENFRHHSDCNRDFVRAELKKFCPNYLKPNQFRYIY